MRLFRAGLVSKAHGFVYHSTLGWTVAKKKKKVRGWGFRKDLGNIYFAESCSGPGAGSHSRLTDFLHHSNLGLRVTKRKKHLPDDGSVLAVALRGFLYR